MLQPTTYPPLTMSDDHPVTVLPSLRLARSGKWVRRLAKLLLVSLMLTILGLLFVPWQQTASGSGSVIAYAPTERQQSVEAGVEGRLVSWGPGIEENAYVEEGQVIAEIRDLDENYLERLRSQSEALDRQIASYNEQITAQKQQLSALQNIIPAYEFQVAAYKTIREQTTAALDAYIDLAKQKVRAEEENIAGAQATETQTKLDYDRQKYLSERGLVSEAKFQEAEQKYGKAKSELGKAKAYLDAANEELKGKTEERKAKLEELAAKIESQNVLLRKSQSDVAKAQAEISKIGAELAKAEKDQLDVESKLSRQSNQSVKAPRAGYVLKLSAMEGQILKKGDKLCVLVPETSDRAVEIYVDGNDAPLVHAGQDVRLQFEGWPAVQIAGWPSVAVGTFGGKVLSVDATDDGKGRFRILVGKGEGDWPEDQYLRQGVRANAWVMLNQVPLGYELWRRVNGFPPSLKDKPEKKSDAKKLIKAAKG